MTFFCIIGAKSGTSAFAIAMLAWGVTLGVNSFPSPRSICTRTPFVTTIYSSSRLRIRYGLKHKKHALPPSIDDDFNTDNKISENENENGGTGQMESLRRTLFTELDKMRNQFVEMSESLSTAKKREKEAQENVALLRERQQSVESEREREINRKKLAFM